MKLHTIYNKHIISIHQDAQVAEAVDTMIKKNINGLAVMNTAHKLVGILSLQDIAAALVPPEFADNVQLASAMDKQGFFAEQCKRISTHKVRDFMRTSFLTVTPETNIMEITADFLKNDIYVVPVVSAGNVLGIITRSEVKKAIAECMHHPLKAEA